MGIFDKFKNKQTPSETFTSQPPITGGNLYTSVEILKAKEDLIRSSFLFKNASNSFRKTQDYSTWYLLQMQADYWSRLASFDCPDNNICRAIYQAFRIAVIYGRSLIWHKDGKLMTFYIDIDKKDGTKFDEWDVPKTLKLSKATNVLMSQSVEQPRGSITMNWDPENMFLLDYSSLGIGGLVYWMPFLKQLELILKMFKNDVWSYYKKYEWVTSNAVDTNAKDLETFVDPDTPFYVRTMAEDDPRELGLKSVEKNSNAEYLKVKEYIDDFLDVYYSLFGRTFNNVKKKERNIQAEAEAGVEGFGDLQSEWLQNCKNVLRWIQKKTGTKIELKEEKEEPNNDSKRMNNEQSSDLKSNRK